MITTRYIGFDPGSRFDAYPQQRDAFSRDLARLDWTFKFFGWFILIGTLKYAAEVTDHGIFNGAAGFLTIELCWIVNSFLRNRVEIELFHEEGKGFTLKAILNIILISLIAGATWYSSSYAVNLVAKEIVEFNKRPH